METTTRFIIDYSDASIWEMPAALFERYEVYTRSLRTKAITDVYGSSIREQWLQSLNADEQGLVIKNGG